MDDDIEVDDILYRKPKGINRKKKGNRVELEIAKFLTGYFNKPFCRSVGSGNRFSQVSLPSHAKNTLIGDICPPENFKWCIECKGGYDEIDLNNIFDGCYLLDKFIKQSLKDAEQSGRNPIIIWKRSRKSLVAIIKSSMITGIDKYQKIVYYNGWYLIPLQELLEKTNKAFWFTDVSSNRNSSEKQ